MVDLSLPPEEHGGDDGKVTSAVYTIRKDSYGVGGWWVGGGGMYNMCSWSCENSPPPPVCPLPMGKLRAQIRAL